MHFYENGVYAKSPNSTFLGLETQDLGKQEDRCDEVFFFNVQVGTYFY